jgi:hypothetical protein
MATHEMITGLAKVIPSGSNGDVLSHIPEQFGALYQSAYEAGYRQGLRDGYAEVCKNSSGGAAFSAGARANAEENSGSRLLGLPCTNCGCFFYSDLSQCPRCKTPKVRRTAEP